MFDSSRGVVEAYGGYCTGEYAVGLLIVGGGVDDEKASQVMKVDPVLGIRSRARRLGRRSRRQLTFWKSGSGYWTK